MMADLFYIKKAPRYGKGAKGLFAKQFIPKGTITEAVIKKRVYYSKLEIAKLSKRGLEFLKEHSVMRNGRYEKFPDEKFNYDNHSCDANCLSYKRRIQDMGNFAIIVRDIKRGEEVTSDYRHDGETIHFPDGCKCGSKNCMRKSTFRPPGSKKLQKFWRDELDGAAKRIPYVKQPLKKELLAEHPYLSYLFEKDRKRKRAYV